MPLCPQITNTPVTVVQTADFTVSSVLPVVPATTTQVDEVIVLVDGKTKAYYQTTAPTTGMTEGDIWFDTDDGYKLYYYTGTAWVSVQDTAIAAAQSAATAAQTTADGKNKIYRQATTPTGTFSVGDLWFNTANDNAISRWDGSTWVANTLGNNALASISANKITAGTIDASVITVSNINAGNISTGTLAAARIATGSLDATKIVAGSITASQISSAYVYAGTITAGQITAGTLTGFTVQTSAGNDAVVLSGSNNALGIKYDGSFAGWLVGIGSGAFMMHYGTIPSVVGYPRTSVSSTTASLAADGSNSLSVTTTGNNMQGLMTFGATVTANSDVNLSSSSELRVPFAYNTTTGNAANVWISSTGQLRRSTASSERYKTDIVNLVDVPELDPKALYSLPVRAFRFKDGYLPTTDDRAQSLVPGFIAEEMDAIYPIAVDYGDGVETWNDRFLVPALLALIQDQETRIQALEGK